MTDPTPAPRNPKAHNPTPDQPTPADAHKPGDEGLKPDAPTEADAARSNAGEPTPGTRTKADAGKPGAEEPTPDARSETSSGPGDGGLEPDALAQGDAAKGDERTDAATDGGKRAGNATDGGKHAGNGTDGGKRAGDGKDSGKRAGGGEAKDGGKPASDATDGGKPASDATDGGKPASDATNGGKPASDATNGGKRASNATNGGKRASDAKGGDEAKGSGTKVGGVKERRRSLVTTLLSIFAVLVVLVGFGFFSGLGPLGRLSQRRDLTAPETLGGLSRITDQQIRERLELDRAADALSQNNKGETSVEAYGDVTSDTGLFVVIALRGKIDVNRVVADSGATPDQVQKRGTSTCTTQTDDIITCYRTSNTLTVMVRNSTGKAGVDKVAPITDEAFKAFS